MHSLYQYIRNYGANLGGTLFLIGSAVLFLSGASSLETLLSLDTLAGLVLTFASLIFMLKGHLLLGIFAGQALGTVGYGLIILKFYFLGDTKGMLGATLSMGVNLWTALKALFRNNTLTSAPKTEAKIEKNINYPFLLPMIIQATGNAFQAYGFYSNELYINMVVAFIWVSAAVFIALSNPKAKKLSEVI